MQPDRLPSTPLVTVLLVLLALVVGALGFDLGSSSAGPAGAVNDLEPVLTARLQRALADPAFDGRDTDGTLAVWVFFTDKGLVGAALQQAFDRAEAELTERAAWRRAKVTVGGRLVDGDDLPVAAGYVAVIGRRQRDAVIVLKLATNSDKHLDRRGRRMRIGAKLQRHRLVGHVIGRAKHRVHTRIRHLAKAHCKTALGYQYTERIQRNTALDMKFDTGVYFRQQRDRHALLARAKARKVYLVRRGRRIRIRVTGLVDQDHSVKNTKRQTINANKLRG